MTEPTEILATSIPAGAGTTASGESLWTSIREALRGSRRDYTEGPLGPAILALAIPMVLEMIMESVFAICDVFFVSRLGSDAIATVGLTESMLTMVYAVAIGLAIGATAMVARRIGEHDRDGAARAAVQALVLGLVVAAALGVFGYAYGERLLGAMGASGGVLADVRYTRIMLGGNATILLLFLVNAIFRGAGDAAIAMRVLWLANLINIALGPCLIFGLGPFPKLGVAGAAIATNIGRGAGVLFAASKLIRRGGRFEIRRSHLRVDPKVIARLARLSATGAFQAFVATASWVALIRIVASFGSAALAGFTVAMRVVSFTLLPAYGLGNAAATMVGQSLGARKPERAERAVWRTGFYNLCFLGGLGLVLMMFSREIITIFSSDPAVLQNGTWALRIIAQGYALYAYGMVISQSFNGAGDTLTPTVLNIAVFWALEIPLAYTLAVPFGFGPRGVYVAITAAFSVLAVASMVIFRRGKWKTKRV